MDCTRSQPARIRTAIGLSIVIHLALLAVVAALTGGPPVLGGSLVERQSLVAVLTIEHRPPPQPTAQPSRRHARPSPDRVTRSAPAAPRRPALPPPAQSLPARAATRPVHPARAAIGAPAAAASQRRPATGLALLSPPRSSVAAPTPTPTPLPRPTATLTPAPSPAPSATATAAPRSFEGLFSQNYPPALAAPGIVEAIRRRLGGGHGSIRIAVDETGHAVAIRFSATPGDAAALDDVRAQLLAQTYVPADCNGLHCDGTLEIDY